MVEKEPRLKVRRGQQIFGPMNPVQIAELLATGRLDQSDLVSRNDGPWLSLEDYIVRHDTERSGDEVDWDDCLLPEPSDASTIPPQLEDSLTKRKKQDHGFASDQHELKVESDGSIYGLVSNKAGRSAGRGRKKPRSPVPARKKRAEKPKPDPDPVTKRKKPARSEPIQEASSTASSVNLNEALEGLAEQESKSPKLKKRPKRKSKRRQD